MRWWGSPIVVVLLLTWIEIKVAHMARLRLEKSLGVLARLRDRCGQDSLCVWSWTSTRWWHCVFQVRLRVWCAQRRQCGAWC